MSHTGRSRLALEIEQRRTEVARLRLEVTP